MCRGDEGGLLPTAAALTPVAPRSVPRPLPSSHVDGSGSGGGEMLSTSPGNFIRRKGVESGVLRRRTTVTSNGPGSFPPSPSVPSSSPQKVSTPVGQSLRRTSVICKLQSARSEDNCRSRLEENGKIGTLQFTLPYCPPSNELLSPDDESPSSLPESVSSPGGVTPSRSLLQIQEGDSIEETEETEPKGTVSALTLDFEQTCGSAGDSETHRRSPSRAGGMYPNWLTGHQTLRTRSADSGSPAQQIPGSSNSSQNGEDMNSCFPLVPTTV